MGRLIDANDAVTAILAERDKIPTTVPAAPYELGMSEPFRYGSAMRGGIRKALRCIEMSPTVGAVPVTRCKYCRHFHLNMENDLYCDNRNGLSDPNPDDFCSYGEPDSHNKSSVL